MLRSRCLSRAGWPKLGLFAACLAAAPALASGAFAAEPPVSVRVEGLTETKLLPTPVTLTGAPVVKDGEPTHACSGSSALAALELGTAGDWGGPWNSGFKQYELYSIKGETHQFEKGSTANFFWSFWLNDREAEVGACEAQVKSGDRVLFFPSCFGEACPKPAPLPLEIEAPSSTNVGEPVSVTVKRFASNGTASEVAGAAVVGGGAGASTDAHGHATLTFAHTGETLLRVTAPEAVRSEAIVCVHAGNDGTCGTQAPSFQTGGGGPSPISSGKPYIGPYAVVARATGVRDSHVYTRRNAPRLLSGVVSAHVPVTSVSIKLRRRHRGRCYSYDGRRERFLAARCGQGRLFKVSSGSSFSYLLPFALGRGEYILDIDATDALGNRTVPARGTSRIRFYVR
jgi:hypothetical protein